MTITTPTYAVGDYVVIDTHDGLVTLPKTVDGDAVYRVTKAPTGARQKNYSITPVGTSSPGVKITGDMLRAATSAQVEQALAKPAAAPLPTVGEVVTSSHLDGTYVVLGLSRSKPDSVKLARLGGDNGTYYPSVAASALTVVSPEKISVNA